MSAPHVVWSVLVCGLGAAALPACVDLDSLEAHGGVGGDASVEGGGSDSEVPDSLQGDAPPTDSAVVDQTTGGDSATDSGAPRDSAADSDAGSTVSPPWWSSLYTSREQLTVSNGAAQILPTGFQLGWPVDVEAVIGPGPFAQLRLVRWDAGSSTWTELPRVIDDPGVHLEWQWARLAAPIAANGTDSSYYLYFGNSSPPSVPNDPATVFDLWDSFSETALGSAWSNNGGYTLTGSELELDVNQHMVSTQTWGPGNAVDFLLRDPSYAGRYWGGLQIPATFMDINPWVVWIARNAASPATIWPEINIDGSSTWAGSPVTPLTTSAVLFGVDWLGDLALFRVQDVVQYSQVPSPTYSSPLSVRFTNESGNPIYISNVRVRQAVNPPPTVTAGAIEH